MNNNTVAKVYIIIINWNGWRDTIECLESVFRNQYDNYRVIVCDNDSEDDSLEKIKQWADGAIWANMYSDSRIAGYTSPPIKKPIQYIEYNRKQAEQGGKSDDDSSLILIQTGANLGFAGGNNVGIRYVLVRDDFEYIWLLNNDTVIEPDALVYLVDRMKAQSNIGICGSTLLYYNQPDKIQALGGATYNKWLGLVKHVGAFESFNNFDIVSIDKSFDYIVGASMLVSKQFIKDVGIMCEDYFLYYEELDWAVRSRGKYLLSYAPESIVYHREGASIGSENKKKSWKADYYGLRNRLYFTCKYYKYALPIIYISFIGVIFNRIKRRQWARVWMCIRLLVNYKS
ncbi:MAG: glycosyl transferase family 2 [Firmicutes bacterium]|nr:glycosyl transferase family 2 [Bacillota bacterium]